MADCCTPLRGLPMQVLFVEHTDDGLMASVCTRTEATAFVAYETWAVDYHGDTLLLRLTEYRGYEQSPTFEPLGEPGRF